VCALVNGGGYAQYCIALEPVTLPIPAKLDMRQAAALRDTLLTAWLNVFMLGHLKAGEWLLVHGGSSGVGSIAIQLARLEGSKVMVTVSNAAKAAVCLKLGAARAINYREEDFAASVEETTSGHGADVIRDNRGRELCEAQRRCAGDGRRLVHSSGSTGGDSACRSLRLRPTRAVVTGSQLRASELAVKQEIVRQVMERVWPHLVAK
jgi:NADPH2:quinone reductase